VQSFYLCGCSVEQHRKVGGGEIDVVVHYRNLILVLELKIGSGEKVLEKGAAQAMDRGYFDAYCAQGKDVYLIPVAFDLDSRTRGMSGYRIEKVS